MTEEKKITGVEVCGDCSSTHVGTCLQCGSTFHAATPENIPAVKRLELVCCGDPIVDCERNCAGMEVCGECGNSGNTRDFMDTHECVSEYEEHVSICAVCGEPIDWCSGHGEIGDPRGYAILTAHDDGDHSRCHWSADCSPRNCAICDFDDLLYDTFSDIEHN